MRFAPVKNGWVHWFKKSGFCDFGLARSSYQHGIELFLPGFDPI
jgi:hypothetical protein